MSAWECRIFTLVLLSAVLNALCVSPVDLLLCESFVLIGCLVEVAVYAALRQVSVQARAFVSLFVVLAEVSVRELSRRINFIDAYTYVMVYAALRQVMGP